jgi:aspartyl-tRNA synthetase
MAARGVVQPRGEGLENPKLPTGKIEAAVQEIEVLNASRTPPFEIEDGIKTNEEIRLIRRYIDLRRPEMQKMLRVRHRVMKMVRDFFDNLGFSEIETPMLAKSTPEGARDFLVPSRLMPNCFYALPQSPQLFKQILMVGGVDKYFQIVRCFRDEDPRADRQAEFTQIDVEMSFVDSNDIIGVHEKLVAKIWKQILGADVTAPMRRMSYKEAMDSYGTDRPDLRFDMKLHDITDIARACTFKVFTTAVEKGGIIKGLCVPGFFVSDRFAESGLCFHPHCTPNVAFSNSSEVGKVFMGYSFPTSGFLYVTTAFPSTPTIGQPSCQVTGCNEGNLPNGLLLTKSMVHHCPVCVCIRDP